MSKIEWTGETWNFAVGCDKVSDGCKNCYAIRMAYRLMHNPLMKEKYAGTAEKTKGGALNWTGKVNIIEEVLLKPFKQRKPTVYFVNSMSDLFHDLIPFETIRLVFGIMATCKEHTFQILTKRPKRALEFFEWMKLTDPDFQNDPAEDAYDLCVEHGIETGCGSAFETEAWPLKNVWIGVSVENQKAADERIPFLMQTPAAVRFLSCEPLLGPIDLTNIIHKICPDESDIQPLLGNTQILDIINGELIHGRIGYKGREIDWVIVGGESGPCSRPMHPEWASSLRDQCKKSNVPFFFKQWGEWKPARFNEPNPSKSRDIGQFYKGKEYFYSGSNSNEEVYGDHIINMRKLGKKLSGRLLEGKQYDEMPIMNS